MERYNFKTVEENWQKYWEEKKTFSTKLDKTDLGRKLKEESLRARMFFLLGIMMHTILKHRRLDSSSIKIFWTLLKKLTSSWGQLLSNQHSN